MRVVPRYRLVVWQKEKEMVVNWSGKKNNSKRSHHEMDAEDGGDVAEGPPRASTAPAPHGNPGNRPPPPPGTALPGAPPRPPPPSPPPPPPPKGPPADS